MIITKKHLSRRSVLRGLGATVALPLLDSMVPACLCRASDDGGQSGAPPCDRLRPNGREHADVDAQVRRPS